MKKFLLSGLIFFAMNLSAYANDDIQQFKQSWLANALKLQREIDSDTPLNRASILGTHNSYNASAYRTLFINYVDPNQEYSLYDQLELGMRSIELDAHWFLSSNFSKEILLCHGQNSHLGCSVFDRPFTEGLQELRDWLKANPNEVVMLYIEKHLDGHEPRLAAQLQEYLGEFIYKPSQVRNSSADSTSCVTLPSETLTKNQIVRAGKQLIIVTKGCDGSHPDYEEQDEFNLIWNDYVFAGIGQIPQEPYTFIDSTFDERVTSFPDCSRSTIFAHDPSHTSMWRLYDDLTTLSNLGSSSHRITADEMRSMVSCDINWQNMDMLEINDDRVAATIWSWAQGYPKPNLGQCAIYKRGEGIENISCATTVTAFACEEKNSHQWKSILATGKMQDGEHICQNLAGATWHFAMPINGMEMMLLKQSSDSLPTQETVLNYQLDGSGYWRATH